MMSPARHNASGKQPEDKSILCNAGWVSVAIMITAAVLASPAVSLIPESVGWAIGAPAFLFATAFLTSAPLVRRRRDRERYWKAGFIVDRPRHRLDDVIYFNTGSGPHYSDCHYWLPEAPGARAYDIFRQGGGWVYGHIVTVPTSAPNGVAARHKGREVVEATTGLRGLADDGFVVRSPGEEHDDLVRALPQWPGILLVRHGRARWLTYQRLTPEEIKTVIACLQRLPPPDEEQ